MTTGGSLSSYMYSTACHHSSHTPPETADTQCVAPRPRYPLWFVVFISQIHAYASSHDAGCHCAPAGGTAPPQFQQLDCRTSNTGAEAPSSVCQRRAESPSPGGEQARASTSITARAAQQLVAAGRDEQTSCSSRRASTRPAACATLALLRRHRRASASSSGGALARAPANAANTCQPLLVASSRRFQIRKTTTFESFRNSVRA